jgi:uncharacterized iron-regulated membrane protein
MMSTTHTQPGLNPLPVPQTSSALGLLFFLLGAPHLYIFLKRRPNLFRVAPPSRYVRAALLAAAIASLMEIAIA